MCLSTESRQYWIDVWYFFRKQWHILWEGKNSTFHELLLPLRKPFCNVQIGSKFYIQLFPHVALSLMFVIAISSSVENLSSTFHAPFRFNHYPLFFSVACCFIFGLIFWTKFNKMPKLLCILPSSRSIVSHIYSTYSSSSNLKWLH